MSNNIYFHFVAEFIHIVAVIYWWMLPCAFLSFGLLKKKKCFWTHFGFILDWLKTTVALCIIHDGEMKLAELAMKIVDLEKEIASKSAKLSLLTSQKNSIMLPLSTNGGSSSAETFGGLLD